MSFWSVIWEYLISPVIVITFILVWFLFIWFIFYPEGLINFIHKDRLRAEKIRREGKRRLAQFNMERREKLKNSTGSKEERSKRLAQIQEGIKKIEEEERKKRLEQINNTDSNEEKIN